MKVIHIMDNLSAGGGVNSFVYDLCYALKEQGCDVSLIGILASKEGTQAQKLRDEGVGVYCLNAESKGKALLSYIPALQKKIKEIAGDEETVCNLHLKLSVLLGCLATTGMKNIVRVETYHSQYSRYSLEYNLMKKYISLYIPCSKSAGMEMKERFRVADDKLRVIPNGINVSGLKNIQPRKSEGMTILSVGRLTRQKNYTVTIKAFNDLCSDSLRYDIIGAGEDEQMLKGMVKNHNIRFLGTMSREEVASRTAGADIVCMPSLWEGLSIYMMEALSLGRPMMLSDIPSFRDAVGEKELDGSEEYRRCSWGYLVSNKPNAYRDALKEFIQSAEKKQMSEASHRLAEQFDIKNTAMAYIEAYSKVGGVLSRVLFLSVVCDSEAESPLAEAA